MKRMVLTLAIPAAFILSACTSENQTDDSASTSAAIAVTTISQAQTQAPAVSTQIPAPTTKASGGTMPAHFCSFNNYSGATYYVQYLYGQSGNSADLGVCAAGKSLTQEQFTDLNLTRECVLSDDLSIKQKRGIVSYYSDGTAAGAAAVQGFCN